MISKSFFLIGLLCSGAVIASSCPRPDQIHFYKNCMTSNAYGMKWQGKCYSEIPIIIALKKASLSGNPLPMNIARGNQINCYYTVTNSSDPQELLSPTGLYEVTINENGWSNICQKGIAAICTGVESGCPFDIIPH